MKFQDLPDPTYDNQPARISAVADLDWYREQHDQALAARDREQDFAPVSEIRGTTPSPDTGPIQPVPGHADRVAAPLRRLPASHERRQAHPLPEPPKAA